MAPQATVMPMIVNPQFEDGAEGWPLREGYRPDANGGRNGTGALVYERTDPKKYPLLHQTVRLEPGARYWFSAWIKTEGVTAGKYGGATVCMEYCKGGKWLTGEYPRGVVGTKDWTHVQAVTTVPKDAEECWLTLYMRPEATGKAWFDDVTITPHKPRWVVYIIRPSRETLTPEEGRVLFGTCMDGLFCKPPDKINAADLACRIEAICAGQVVRDGVWPVREDRIAADIGKLPEGTARLRLTLLDTRHRWILSKTEIPLTVASRRGPLPANFCVIDARGRAVVNGKPFLPVGLYHHSFRTREDLETIAKSPFNCIMPYNSLYMRFSGSQKKGVAGVAEVMDACDEKGLRVIFSIKDVYEGTHWAALRALGAQGETAVVEKAVASFLEHPALLAWYINDELPTTMLDRLTARRREVNRLDPFHPTWAVFCSFGEVPFYGPTCDVVGVDPYPIRDEKSRDMKGVQFGMDMATRAVGTPEGMAVWAVPQIMNWACYDAQARKDRAYYQAKFRDPTEYEMLSMSLLCAIQGAKGFIYYSYSDLSGVINANAKPDFERRWPEVCKMAEEMVSLAPFLLSDTDGPAVRVDVEAGGVLAKGFRDEAGRIRVLVAGVGPGESRAVLTIGTQAPLKSRFGKSVAVGGGKYRFHGMDICSDILGSERQ